MDRILIIMKKNNGHQGIICPFTGAFFHNMQTCLLVYTYNRSQVSVYRTIGPLVFFFYQKFSIFTTEKISMCMASFRNFKSGDNVLVYSVIMLRKFLTLKYEKFMDIICVTVRYMYRPSIIYV